MMQIIPAVYYSGIKKDFILATNPGGMKYHNLRKVNVSVWHIKSIRSISYFCNS